MAGLAILADSQQISDCSPSNYLVPKDLESEGRIYLISFMAERSLWRYSKEG